jgi:hypothetical protein
MVQALSEDPLAMRGNELPTLRMPATNVTGAIALAEPEAAVRAPLQEEPQEAVPSTRAATAPQASGALFGLALAIAAVATAAAVYLFLRVATLERQVRLLEQRGTTQPK